MATTKKTSTKESTVEETTSNKVTKFQKQLELSHSQIKGKRAAFLNEEAEVAMRRSVDSMKDTLREYRREEMALEDFYPTSTMYRHEMHEEHLFYVFSFHSLKLFRDI